jgi:hypothetical protein
VGRFHRAWRHARFWNTDYLLNPKRAAFARYLQDAKIYRCPAERTCFKRPGNKRLVKIRSYSMNDYITPVGGGSMGAKYHFNTASDMLKPSTTFVFIDSEPASICYMLRETEQR